MNAFCASYWQYDYILNIDEYHKDSVLIATLVYTPYDYHSSDSSLPPFSTAICFFKFTYSNRDLLEFVSVHILFTIHQG